MFNSQCAFLSHPKLHGVSTLCRHGERNIEYTFPNDQWKSTQYWPGGYGQLTNVMIYAKQSKSVENWSVWYVLQKGKRQLYEVGEYLQKRYGKLLQDVGYSSNEVYIQSTVPFLRPSYWSRSILIDIHPICYNCIGCGSRLNECWGMLGWTFPT